MIKLANYIDGQLTAPVNGQYLDNWEPATGQVYSAIPDSDKQDLDMAVDAATAAFPMWSNCNPQERAANMLRLADLIDAHAEELAQAESKDNGKSIAAARLVDIPRSSANLRFFAAAATQFSGQSFEMPSTAINYTLHQPLGVVGCISPWNLPLYLFTWKIAPALASGNCVIGKPSEVTPYTAFLLSELAQKAEFPRGVLNIVHGRGAQIGSALVNHPQIKAVSFTGGTATGARIALDAAPKFKKLSLELGGKNPSIVFADANFDMAVRETMRAAFWNQGEVCLCGSRILVQQDIYTDFVEAFVARTKKLNVGDPLQETTDIGAIVSAEHLQKILSYIELAKSEGGRILCGGTQRKLDGRCQNGWFVSPTVIDQLSMDCRVNQEEIFGPVVTIVPFRDEQDAIAQANNSAFGLAASIWSENIGQCHRVAAQLEAGQVWINTWMMRDLRTPFGGVKQSGLGREGGFEAMKFFTETKNICVKLQHD